MQRITMSHTNIRIIKITPSHEAFLRQEEGVCGEPSV